MESNHKDSKIHFTKNCMNRNIVRLIFMGIFALNCVTLSAKQQIALVGQTPPGLAGAPAAVQPGRLGQLGLGGTYYAANGGVRNTASGNEKFGCVETNFLF